MNQIQIADNYDYSSLSAQNSFLPMETIKRNQKVLIDTYSEQIKRNWRELFPNSTENIRLEVKNSIDGKIIFRMVEGSSTSNKLIGGWVKDMDCLFESL